MSEKAVQDILLRIGVTGDKSVSELKDKNIELLKSILANQKAIEQTKKANVELSKAEGDNTDAIVKNIAKMNELKEANKVHQTQLNQNMSLITAEMGSLKEKRTQLSVMTAEYTKMSAAEKLNSEHGKALGKGIKDLTDALKAEEKQIGQTYRNVGNYTDSIIEANKAQGLGGTMIGKSISAFKGFKDSAMAASGGTGVLNGSLKMLAANPIMAIIAVVAAVFFALKEAIGSSSQATNTLKQAMAPFQVIMKVVNNLLVSVVQIFLDAFLAISKFTTAIADFIGGNDKYSESVKNSVLVEKERQKLVGDNRKLLEEEAKNNLDIAKLRDKVTEKDKYSRKERGDALNQAIVLEKKAADVKKDLATRELKNLEDQLKAKDQLKAEETKLLDFYVEKTGADRAKLKAFMKAETSLTAEQAVEYGFVSKVIIPVLNSKKEFTNKFEKMNEGKIKEIEASLSEKSRLIDRLLAKVGLKVIEDVVAMEVTAGDGTVITVTGESVAVGAGASPDGTFVMTDGSTVVVAGGVITALTPIAVPPVPPVVPPVPPVPPVDDLAALKAENEALKAQIASMQASQTAIEAVASETTTLLAELKAIKSEYVVATRKDDFVEPPMSKVDEKLKAAQDKRAARNK